MTTDLSELEARLRGVYERGRVRYAAYWGLPIGLALVAIGLVGGHDRASVTLAFVLAAACPVILWRGSFLERAWLRGLVAGAIPLATVLGSRVFGHVCTPSGCISLCVPACAAGGAVAGLVLSRLAASERHRLASLALASAFAWSVGSLGCCCVSRGATVGAAIGLAGLAGSLLQRLFTTR